MDALVAAFGDFYRCYPATFSDHLLRDRRISPHLPVCRIRHHSPIGACGRHSRHPTDPDFHLLPVRRNSANYRDPVSNPVFSPDRDLTDHGAICISRAFRSEWWDRGQAVPDLRGRGIRTAIGFLHQARSGLLSDRLCRRRHSFGPAASRRPDSPGWTSAFNCCRAWPTSSMERCRFRTCARSGSKTCLDGPR